MAYGDTVTLTAECASKGARDLMVKRILVAPGDRVVADELMLITEFYKVVTELRAPEAGTIERIHVARDDEVQVGDKLIDMRFG